MIEIYRYDNKWRMKIVNETLEFDSRSDMIENFTEFCNSKEKCEPYKEKE